MRNTFLSIKKKMVSRYLLEDKNINKTKSTDIKILLNRVKLDKKKESRKKL